MSVLARPRLAQRHGPPPRLRGTPLAGGSHPGGAAEAERARTDLAAPVRQQAPRRLLVVDDEPTIRLICRINLRLAGFEVVEAADGATAVELLRDGGFDLVLLDVMMPGMGGLEVLDALRSDPGMPPVPVVLLSARAEREDVLRGFDRGALDYVTKPFDPLVLGEHLHAVLAAVEAGDPDRMRRARLGDGAR